MIFVNVVKKIQVQQIENLLLLLPKFNLEQENITCRELRRMGPSISALSAEQITSIPDDILFQCIGAFGAINDYNPDRLKQIAQKYIQV